MRLFWAAGISLARAVLLLVLVCVGTVLLMRMAPGYATDAAELDGVHAVSARAAGTARLGQEGSPLAAAARALRGLAQGDLGVSRQYGLPVVELLRPRLGRSAALLVRGLAAGWLLALLGASARLLGRTGWLAGAAFTVLLAVPVGALSTVFLVRDVGGPALALALVVAARDFQFLDRLLCETWATAPLVYARACGVTQGQLVRVHLLPAVLPRLGALLTLSVLTALGALLPVEVLFDVPGVAQMAWAAAGNRDLPVLLGATLVLAGVVALLAAAGRDQRGPAPFVETA